MRGEITSTDGSRAEAQAYPRPAAKPNSRWWIPVDLRSTGTGRAGPEAGAQALQDLIGHQAADVTTVGGDFLDQAGAQERVQRVGRHEQGLHPGQAVVHLGHHLLVLEV